MSTLEQLLQAKDHSDKKQYGPKTEIVRNLIKKLPDEFHIDSEGRGVVGLTHKPTKFKIHLPKEKVKDLNLKKVASVPLMVKNARLDAEIADTEEERRLGLSHRTELKDGQGMLFTKAGHFWMKDTHIPLDLVFMDKSGEVTDIIQMAVEQDKSKPTRMYGPANFAKVATALEVPHGWCMRNNVRIGDRVVVAS